MKSYIGLLLLLLIAYSKSDSDCEKIKPEKASDCVLSEKDRKTYKYCCLQKLAGTLYCDAYNQDDYEIQKAAYDAVYDSKLAEGMTYTFECNPSSFLKLSFIAFIFILL